MRDYPYFVDVRSDGLNEDVAFTSEVPQLTMAWSSPVDVDEEANAGRTVATLIESSPASWRSKSTDIMPNLGASGDFVYAPEGEQKANALAVMLEGSFTSYFDESPLLDEPEEAEEDIAAEGDAADAEGEEDVDTLGTITTVVEKSPESARLIVIGSASFLADQTLRMIGSADGTIYTSSLEFMANLADWAVEDESLLGIRSRSHFNRTLEPMAEDRQRIWEYANYVLALAGLALVFGISRQRQAARKQHYQEQLGMTS